MAQISGAGGGGSTSTSVGGTYIAAGVVLADGASHAFLLDSQGNLRVNPGALTSVSDSVLAVPQRPTTATPSRPSAVANVNATILVLNASRWGASIFNEGPGLGYVKLGATATTTSYWCQMPAGSYIEVPFGYTGIIDAITAAATPTAQFQVNEFVA